MAGPKTHETSNAIYYDRPNDIAATIITAVSNAAISTANKIQQDRDKKEAMKRVWVTLDPDQQAQLMSSWTDKEKKFYGVSVRGRTADEIAESKTRQAQATLAEENVAQIPTQRRILEAQAVAGESTSALEKRKLEIIENKDGKYSLWDQAFAQGLRDNDAEKWVLQKTHPDLADEILQINNKVGPKFEKRLVGEYFQQLIDKTGTVDPKYTLPTAQALAKAVSSGDISELDRLNKDKGWPEAMKTLAYRNFQLDRDRLNNTIAEQKRSDKNIRAQLTTSLLTNFADQGIGPTTATATVDALLSGQPKPPDWAQGRWNEALKQADQLRQIDMAKRSTDLAEKMSGIPEIRSSMDSLRQLEAAGVGKNTKQIEALKKEMMQRMSKLYQLDPAELEDKGSMWYRMFSGAIDYMSAGVQTGVALAGDAAAGLGAPGDSLIQQLMQDETPTPGLTGPAPGHAGAQTGFGSQRPDFSIHGTPNANPQSRVATSSSPDRASVIARSAQRLIGEFNAATPERQAQIKLLLKAIKDDPDGAAALNLEVAR